MITIGAQTYTLRTFMQNERDIRRSLKKVADIGYKTVQISGIGPIDPHMLRDICDENGLKIVLTHNPENRILNDTDALIKEHDILGCDYIGIGGMPERYRSTAPEWVENFAVDFEVAAKKMRDAGKLLMYHNHARWPQVHRRADGRPCARPDGIHAGYLLAAGGGLRCSAVAGAPQGSHTLRAS